MHIEGKAQQREHFFVCSYTAGMSEQSSMAEEECDMGEADKKKNKNSLCNCPPGFGTWAK